jgi:hypothetical protein
VSGHNRAARRTADAVLAVLAILGLAIVWCLRPTGGLAGRYALGTGGTPGAIVHERIDPGLDFPVPQRLDAAYLFHWDMRRFGFPAAMPPYAVRWSGALLVPEDGAYGFAIDAQGRAALRIDGAPLDLQPETLTERRLSAGPHPIEADYDLTEGEARFVLKWRPPGGRLVPIPSARLIPDPTAAGQGGSRRAAGWILLVGSLAGAGLAAAAARRRGSPASRMAERLWSERTRLALGAILILAAILRFHDAALVPFHHETADEYQHAWEGWNLLHHGVPQAWSTFPDRYPIEHTNDLRWFGDRYVLVEPYFDHPPLFSVLVGLVTTGADLFGNLESRTPPPRPYDAFACTLPVMRVVPIVLSLIGIALLYRLALLYGAGERAALLGAFVYAVLPVIVLSHRLVKAENLLSLLLMGAILAAHRHAESGAWRPAVCAGALSGLAIWTKATGVAVPAVVLVILLGAGRRRAAGIVAGIMAGFAALYVLYGLAYDGGIFLKVLQAQATTKWVGIEAAQDLLTGKVVTKWFGRGAYLWLLLAAALAAFRRARPLLLPIALYAMVIVLTGDQRVIYGWYRIPLYPFLCVAAGMYLEDLLDRPHLDRAFPFALSAVAAGLYYALPASRSPSPEVSKTVVWVFAVVALGPFLPRLIRERPWTGRLAAWGAALLIGLFAVTSVATVWDLLNIYSATRGH